MQTKQFFVMLIWQGWHSGIQLAVKDSMLQLQRWLPVISFFTLKHGPFWAQSMDLHTRAVNYSKIIIYTNTMNMVDIFNSLWCTSIWTMPSAWFCIALHILYTLFNPSALHNALSHWTTQYSIPVINTIFNPKHMTPCWRHGVILLSNILHSP